MPFQGRFRDLSAFALKLLAAFLSLSGIFLIVIGYFFTGTPHDGLIGIGAAIFATGPVTIVVWVITDKISSQELSMHRGRVEGLIDGQTTSLNRVVANNTGILKSTIMEQTEALENRLREEATLTQDYRHLGILRAYSTRSGALDSFAELIYAELERAAAGVPGTKLWIIGTDLLGVTNYHSETFKPENILRDAVNSGIDLKILMSDPEYLAARASAGDVEKVRLAGKARFLELTGPDFSVPEASIRYYPFRPTIFGISTSRHMLLNPYPLRGAADQCLTIVLQTDEYENDPVAKEVFARYLELHFVRTWSAGNVRETDAVPPFVPSMRAHGPGVAEMETLRALLESDTNGADGADGHYRGRDPRTADLLEFSGESVRGLLDWLVEHDFQIRLLVRDSEMSELSEHQIRKISRTVERFRDRPNVEIRSYRASPSLRGRRLGSHLINLSWYTPDYYGVSDPTGVPDIVGDKNPSITSSIRCDEGEKLDRMFDEVFEQLWDHSDLTIST